MQAKEADFLTFLKASPQFIIPIYQRTYSWTDKQCLQLWDDILRAGSTDQISVHFVGSIVYVAEGLNQVTKNTPLLVIDGQQRLATLTLLLEALAREVGEDEPVEGFSAKKIREYYLTNHLEKVERFYKLNLSKIDDSTLKAIVKNIEMPQAVSIRISENFLLFQTLLRAQKGDFTSVCQGLAKLMVVDIALSRDQDNPQLIFESMNSTGKELSQADLIRNYILMGLKPDLQTRLYEEYWQRMEEAFGQEAYGAQFDSFMRDYLTVRTGSISRIDDVYEAFKTYAKSAPVHNDGIEALVKDIRTFAGYYCAIALGAEADASLKRAFQDLRELKVDVAYPFLLEVYDDYSHTILSLDQFLDIVRLVESYVFRRAVCSIPTNSMNKTFATLSKTIVNENYLETVRANFQLLPSYRRFPTDQEFHRDIQTRDLYHFRSKSYLLRKLENHDHKEPASIDEYTIEHVLPQNPQLSNEWKDALGSTWEQIQQEYLHTLGNLTLTGYNSEYSDHPFLKKRDMKGGFRDSHLQLNASLAESPTWNEESIRARANELATKAVTEWPSPQLPEAIVSKYRVQKESSPTYSIENHPNLMIPFVNQLFETFRAGVLALDPCVVEVFLKLYVAYKAETNFVDVFGQTRGVSLTLNMNFPDLIDPRGIAVDVTGRGLWGNGNVQVKVTSLDQIPYALGLVRQSLERQLGDGE